MTDYLGPYLLGPNDENHGIYTGDARELAKAIPDESVDLIFTDPVYQNIDDYRWLAETAARVLKPSGNLLVWTSTPYKKTVLLAVDEIITFVWDLSVVRGYRPIGDTRDGTFLSRVQPCLWFNKTGIPKAYATFFDIEIATNKRNNHDWNKDISATLRWTGGISYYKSVILDPFTGGGTVPAVCKMLSRRWLAFEIDPNTAERARERVRMTQPPLFVPEPEQMTFEAMD